MMAVTDGTECFKLVRRTQGVFLLMILCASLWNNVQADNPRSCETAKQYLLAKQFAVTEILERPSNGDVCGVDSCCGPVLENRLTTDSRVQLGKFLKESLYRLNSILNTRAKRFDDFFRNLMATSKKEFHEMFKKTYGVIYLQHSFVFTDFFEELERYYNNGRVRLADALENFFSILYQRMFTVINAQYQFDDRYLECVAEHMTELRPFGDVPHKLGVQLRRSFVATRAFYTALTIGADVARNMVNLTPSEKCGIELARMQHCDKCLGIKSPGSCSSYCISVLQSCLLNHVALDVQWNNFVDALDKVADRLLGPFNIEMVVEPINIKISEAVMIFQENGAEVSQRIFSGCGNPVLQRRRRNTANQEKPVNNEEPRVETRKVKDAEDEITFESLNFNTNPNSSNNKKKRKKVEAVATLEKLIKDIKQRVKDSRQFWSQLPYQFCNNEAAASSADGNCWNGTALGKFENIQQTSVAASTPPLVNQQIFILQALVSKLQAAYQGQDVDLSDDSDDVLNASGSGSGENEIEGSGTLTPYLNIPDIHNRAETEPPSPPPPSLPTSTSPPNASQGSSAISGPTLAKALAHYLLPIVLVWFGGAFSDLLL